MAKEIIFRKMLGCPTHGTILGRTVSVKRNNIRQDMIPAYKCDVCMRVYMDPIGHAELGYTGKHLRDYEVWYAKGPVQAPNVVYVYDKHTNKGVCNCRGDFLEKTRAVTELLLESGMVEHINARICKKCNKVFITNNVFNNKRDELRKNGITVINSPKRNAIHNPQNVQVSHDQEAIKSDTAKPIKIEQPVSPQYDWEDDVFGHEVSFDEEETLSDLKPANRVAVAYYDANIKFNPYQYLPWLKVFINGSRKLLISDEVGLGKTIEAGILVMEQLTQNVNTRILILCPAFLREKWYQELKDKFLLESYIYDGKTNIDETANIIILPISRIRQYLEQENIFSYSMVIIDEIHYFKNGKSARYGYLRKLLDKIGDSIRVFMSATPVNNSGNDYHSIEILFDAKPDRTNTTKKQAYIYLPERHINDVYVDLTQEEQTFYDATDALDPFAGTVYRHIGSSCLYALSKYAYSGNELPSETKEELRNSLEMLMDGVEITDLEDNCFTVMKKLPAPEMDSKLEKLQDILSRYPAGSKIVLFSHYIETVKYLHSSLSASYRSGYIYANSISNNIPCRNIKNKFVDAKEWFCEESDTTTILICSDTCREGIDLDVANVLINYDLPFNPSILEQRIGRIDRMSQKNDMDIYNFHVNYTYDDRLHFILAAKLRFINFYADYGIGNPLNITEEGNHTFESFIRYFGKRISKNKLSASMSNDDYYVAGRILRQIGVKLEKKDGIDALRMQAVLLDCMKDNQGTIENWFDQGALKRLTEEELLKQRQELERLLNFPNNIRRKIVIDDSILDDIVAKANANPQFRRRIAVLIKDYKEKLDQMEITGLPMKIDPSEIRKEYDVGVESSESFIQRSVVEILRNEGASIYELD